MQHQAQESHLENQVWAKSKFLVRGVGPAKRSKLEMTASFLISTNILVGQSDHMGWESPHSFNSHVHETTAKEMGHLCSLSIYESVHMQLRNILFFHALSALCLHIHPWTG